MASKSTSKFRLGAVLVQRGYVLNTSTNNMGRTHPAMERHRKGASFPLGLHAEVGACLGVAPGELVGSEIYVARVLRNGSLALAKPCEICQRFLRAVGVERVYYSSHEGWNEWAS